MITIRESCKHCRWFVELQGMSTDWACSFSGVCCSCDGEKTAYDVRLKVVDAFQQAWRGCAKPMHFKVLNIDREKNMLKVKCTDIECYSHEEEWDDLDVTERSFGIGEYKFID